MTDRIDVRDDGNHERLLGSLPITALSRCAFQDGPIHMAIATHPLRLATHHPENFMAEIQVNRVTIYPRRRYSVNGWKVDSFVTTTGELDTLMKLPDFRLPKETPSQADVRQHYA